MPIYKQTTEITNIDKVWANINKDIVEVYFGDKNVFTVWAEIENALPLTVYASGDDLVNYKVFGNTENGESVGERTANLFDKNSENNLHNHSIRSSTGEIIVTNFFTVTHKIDVTGGQSYVAEVFDSGTTAYIYIVEYDEDDQFVKSTSLTTTGGRASKVITLDAATAYVRMSLLTLLLGKIIFVPGSTAPASYIPFGYKLPMTVSDGNTVQTIPVYIGKSQLVESEYVSYSEGKIYRKNPANYFDGYFELGAIDYQTGEERPGDTSIRTDFIELEPSNRYYFKWKTGNLYILPVSYDENKDFVRYLGAKSTNPSYFDLGANEKYIRFYLYNTTTPPKEMMVCKNANAPYYDPQDPPAPIPALPTTEGETTFEYDGGEPQPEQMYVKYNSWSGWSDIDNYKMDNGDWTQEAT